MEGITHYYSTPKVLIGNCLSLWDEHANVSTRDLNYMSEIALKTLASILSLIQPHAHIIIIEQILWAISTIGILVPFSVVKENP